MTTTDNNTLANAAAEWWATAVANPRFDNGDESSAGGMAMVMAMMANKQEDGDTITAFKEKLAERITAELETGRNVSLGCDYHPDAILADAAAEAGMTGSSMTTLPWKTHMWVNPNEGTVTVSAGYAAPSKTVYPAEEAA